MIQSHTRRISVKRQPATLTVIRSDGYCWGRLVLDSGEQLDVTTRADLYERDDEEALDALERAAKRGRTEPATGWL